MKRGLQSKNKAMGVMLKYVRRLGLLPFLLALGCAPSPTSIDIALTLDPNIRTVEVSGRNGDGSSVFPLSEIPVADDVREGSAVIILPESAPRTFELMVHGLSATRQASIHVTQTVTLRLHEVLSLAVTLGPPVVCEQSPCAECGDGRLDADEGCDDENNAAGDGCTLDCIVETQWQCAGQPSVCNPTTAPAECGNGIIETTELCDDGNPSAADGCSDLCVVEGGFACIGQPSVCTVEVENPVCGDGQLGGAEDCDDGDRDNQNGCHNNCTVAAGYICTGEPSVCLPDCSQPCGATCPNNGCCTSVCTSGNCNLFCPGNCDCTLDCGGSDNCDVECARGSSCRILCDGATNCTELDCVTGAECIAECGTSMSCDFWRCGQAGVSQCPGNVLACRTPCP